MTETSFYIGLGGNLGDPKEAMSRAIALLDATEKVAVVSVSALYRTPPWGKLDQPDFLNACAKIATSLEPEAFLTVCQNVETRLHRVRDERWGPRTLDIDLLTWSGGAFHSDRLDLPHPRMNDRAFVLVPLADIAPSITLKHDAGIVQSEPIGWHR